MKKDRTSIRLDEDSINIVNIIMEHCSCKKTDAIQLALDMTIGTFSTEIINYHYNEIYKPSRHDGRKERHNNIE